MTLRRKLAVRYAVVVGGCLLLLAGLAHHEFIAEPNHRRALNIPELPANFWGEFAEVFFYGMIPLVLGLGWWLMRQMLNPLNALARGVERIHAGNLHEPLPHFSQGDEVARLTEVFNAMTARLDQSFQQIREFTLHASHELKTPLTVMRAQLDTELRDAEKLPLDRREWMLSLLDEVRRLARIVDTLTLLSKADAGLLKLEKHPLRLDSLVRECFEDAVSLAEEDGIKTTLARCDELVVPGDRDRLRQLLLNLADNAVKYNQPDGTVTISLERAGGAAEIKISNTGEGISQALQGRIFDRFVRGDGARSKAVEGSGLGLAICRWIVQEHHGSIQVATAPDRTTTAVVRLPLAE